MGSDSSALEGFFFFSIFYFYFLAPSFLSAQGARLYSPRLKAYYCLANEPGAGGWAPAVWLVMGAWAPAVLLAEGPATCDAGAAWVATGVEVVTGHRSSQGLMTFRRL